MSTSSSWLNNFDGFVYINCEICTRKIVQTREKYHYKYNHNRSKITDESKIARCKISGCTAYFLTKRQLKDHRLLEHKRNTNLDVTSTDVSNMCGSNSTYSNAAKFVCAKCGKRYQFRWNYKKHTCSPERFSLQFTKPRRTRNKCEKCGMKFKSKEKLINHLKNHKLEGKSNSSNSAHLKNACQLCEKSCRTSWHYKSILKRFTRTRKSGNGSVKSVENGGIMNTN